MQFDVIITRSRTRYTITCHLLHGRCPRTIPGDVPPTPCKNDYPTEESLSGRVQGNVFFFLCCRHDHHSLRLLPLLSVTGLRRGHGAGCSGARLAGLHANRRPREEMPLHDVLRTDGGGLLESRVTRHPDESEVRYTGKTANKQFYSYIKLM